MSIEELCALPVADLAAPDSALFLLYRKVLLWRTLDIKVARTEAGIANKR